MVPQEIAALAGAHELSLHLVVLAGSRSYALDGAGSDDDYLGVFTVPARRMLSIAGLDRDTHAGNDPDFTLHEIGKFCRLALAGNPAILETLWNPRVLSCDAWGERLRASRSRCLHRGSLGVYVAYAEAQMKKMVRGSGMHSKGGVYGGKFGMHLLRLLHAGLALGRTGEVMVEVPERLRRRLLDVRGGKATMEEVRAEADPLLAELKELSRANALPEGPDAAAFDALVVEARMARR